MDNAPTWIAAIAALLSAVAAGFNVWVAIASRATAMEAVEAGKASARAAERSVDTGHQALKVADSSAGAAERSAGAEQSVKTGHQALKVAESSANAPERSAQAADAANKVAASMVQIVAARRHDELEPDIEASSCATEWMSRGRIPTRSSCVPPTSFQLVLGFSGPSRLGSLNKVTIRVRETVEEEIGSILINPVEFSVVAEAMQGLA